MDSDVFITIFGENNAKKKCFYKMHAFLYIAFYACDT